MSEADDLIRAALRLAGDDSSIRQRAGVGGGSISQALRLRTGRGDYLIKLGGRGRPGFFAAEARGLGLLAGTGAVRVPAVLGFRDAELTTDDRPPTTGTDADRSVLGRRSSAVDASYILLEWLEPPPAADRSKAGAALGTSLAALHRASADAYGLDHDNYIGATHQPNGWRDSWAAFFGEQRLGFQASLARQNGLLPPERAGRIERLVERLDRWIDDRATQPSLLHGDLWGGNFIVGPGGAPALIDPAAYYGDREADLAMTRLFGGFPASFYQAYAAAWPLPAGWQERVELYNLYHLLNHLNLFGGSYAAEVDATLARYVG